MEGIEEYINTIFEHNTTVHSNHVDIKELFSELESDSKEQEIVTELFYRSATMLQDLAFQLANDLSSDLLPDSEKINQQK